jgi:hypothetical protein
LTRWCGCPQGPYYSIDVECVATGPGHNARAIAQIGLVDANGRCVLNLFVKPPAGSTVASYLTPLTGITAEMLAQCAPAHGPSHVCVCVCATLTQLAHGRRSRVAT